MMPSPASEGERHLKIAAKALKTNPWLFKFKPDLETAALGYQDAAKWFQSVGQHDLALNALKEFAHVI